MQGRVLVECVVEADGTVSRAVVVRSLDQEHGLDHEAVLAAKQWRFEPGLRMGQPVPVLVTIELNFAIRPR
jgi:protein TonB